ncbi:MAG: hypothetical protein HYV61_08815 [Candidatus Rokubacteria bacterium]|nr:hypothetical protein [Candidatus Rokubacteria bacterium]
MRLVLRLLAWRARAASAFVREREVAKLVVAGGFALLFGLVVTGEYLFFVRAFRAVLQFPVAAPALTLYALEGFLALVFVLAVVSFVVTGSAVFFRARENRLLLTTPLPLRALFLLRAVETALLTSWSFGVLALPALLALGSVWERRAGFYLAGLALLGGFVLFAAALGTLITAATAAALGHFRSRAGIVAVGGGLLALAAALLGRFVIPTQADLYALFQPGSLNGTPAAIYFLEAKFTYWPSHPFASALFGMATGGLAHRLPGALTVSLGLVLGACLLAAWPGRALFTRAIREAAEGVVVARPEGEVATPRGRAVFPVLLRGPVGALLEKDLLGFLRNPQEVGRGLFLAFLLVLYTVFLFRIPTREIQSAEEVVARLVAFTLVATGYFLTTFALRFVFPAISLEGRMAWVVFSSPLSFAHLLLAKFTLYTLGLFGVMEVLSLVGLLRLGVGLHGFVWWSLLLFLMTLTVVSVALALGTLWPNFREENAEALATNAGGLLTSALCLGYVGLVGWLGYRFFLGLLGGERPLGWVAAVAGLSLLVAAGPLWRARRAAAAFEVV